MIGYRLAQAGGVLMVLGGVVDLSIREVLPHHEAALGAGSGMVHNDAAFLVLALLRALGGALVAAGLAVLVLLHLARRHRDRLPLFAAAAVALVAEGPNVLGILGAGSPLFLAPLSFMLLVVAGVALMLRPGGLAHTGAGSQEGAAARSHTGS